VTLTIRRRVALVIVARSTTRADVDAERHGREDDSEMTRCEIACERAFEDEVGEGRRRCREKRHAATPRMYLSGESMTAGDI
jgi:hypothetical protein